MLYEIKLYEKLSVGAVTNKSFLTDKYRITTNKWGVKKLGFKQNGKKSTTYITIEKSACHEKLEVTVCEATTGRVVERFN